MIILIKDIIYKDKYTKLCMCILTNKHKHKHKHKNKNKHKHKIFRISASSKFCVFIKFCVFLYSSETVFFYKIFQKFVVLGHFGPKIRLYHLPEQGLKLLSPKSWTSSPVTNNPKISHFFTFESD